MALTILPGCINCGNCRHVCPTDNRSLLRHPGPPAHHRTPRAASTATLCVDACPVEVIEPDNAYVHDPDELASAKALAAEVWKERGPLIQQVLKVMRQRNSRWAREREERRDDPDRYRTGNRQQ